MVFFALMQELFWHINRHASQQCLYEQFGVFCFLFKSPIFFFPLRIKTA